MRFKSDGRVEVPRDAPTTVRVRQSRRHWRVEQVLKSFLGAKRARDARHREAAAAAVKRMAIRNKDKRMVPLSPSGSDDGRLVYW